jgi:hypothetical protein
MRYLVYGARVLLAMLLYSAVFWLLPLICLVGSIWQVLAVIAIVHMFVGVLLLACLPIGPSRK